MYLYETPPTAPTAPRKQRRVVGPIPPRDRLTGRLCLLPTPGMRPKLDANGQFVRNEAGAVVEHHVADTRPAAEYLGFQQSDADQVDPAALKGLSLFRVELNGDIEPPLLTYGRDEAEAIRVAAKEWGVRELNPMQPAKARRFSDEELKALKDSCKQEAHNEYALPR